MLQAQWTAVPKIQIGCPPAHQMLWEIESALGTQDEACDVAQQVVWSVFPERRGLPTLLSIM